jgi:hypothetical protein
MENATKAIMIGASIVIVLVIVSIAFLVLRSGQDTAKLGLTKMEQVNGDIKESDIKMYDRMTISGSEVVNLLSKYQKGSFGLKVITGKDTTGTWYIKTVDEAASNALGSDSSADMGNTMVETSDKYVNPNGKFMGKILRDKNGSVTGIVLAQQP